MSRCDNCPSIGAWIVMFLGAIAIAFMIWMSGWAHGRTAILLQAVKEGHAQWVPDPETGRAYIEWKK